jgi:lysophospholipase L1-like esterase
MVQARRVADYTAAAAVAALAVAINPLVILLVTGRPDLSLRVNVVSITFDVFLAFILCALLTRGRARARFFHLVAWTFPLVLLAGLEGAALSLRLADRIALLEDTSPLLHRNRWVASESRWAMTPGGFRLYRPWVGDGIVINDLGLRTAPPTTKAAGEWHIAVTGGSTVWGWRVLDADTIPVRLQEALHRQGHTNVTVYNFGIEGATLTQELALLKHFREIYGIDQALFYTGGNDVFSGYLGATSPSQRMGPFWEALSTFELTKTIERLVTTWREPSAQRLTQLDEQVLPQILRDSSLRKGINAATDYCRMVMMRCDVVLQPFLLGRQSPAGSEAAIVQSLKRVYPRLDVLSSQLYRDALAAAPAGQVHDLSGTFDQTSQQVFIDSVHLTEAGNELVAQRLVPIVAPGLR